MRWMSLFNSEFRFLFEPFSSPGAGSFYVPVFHPVGPKLFVNITFIGNYYR